MAILFVPLPGALYPAFPGLYPAGILCTMGPCFFRTQSAPEGMMNMSFERIGIRPAEILLPAPGVRPETWACIACDQYTSEPEYWRKAYALAGDAPSALRLRAGPRRSHARCRLTATGGPAPRMPLRG